MIPYIVILKRKSLACTFTELNCQSAETRKTSCTTIKTKRHLIQSDDHRKFYIHYTPEDEE